MGKNYDNIQKLKRIEPLPRALNEVRKKQRPHFHITMNHGNIVTRVAQVYKLWFTQFLCMMFKLHPKGFTDNAVLVHYDKKDILPFFKQYFHCRYVCSGWTG